MEEHYFIFWTTIIAMCRIQRGAFTAVMLRKRGWRYEWSDRGLFYDCTQVF